MQSHLNGSLFSSYSFPLRLLSFFSIWINLFIFAIGSLCTDNNVETLLLRKALWTSLKIFHFCSLLLFIWWPQWHWTDCLALGLRVRYSWHLVTLMAVGILNHQKSLLHYLAEEFLGLQLGQASLMTLLPLWWWAEASNISTKQNFLVLEKTEIQVPTSRSKVSLSVCFNVNVRDLNSGPHVCEASAFPSEPGNTRSVSYRKIKMLQKT